MEGLRNAPWLTDLSVDDVIYRPASETLPWGIDTVDADRVRLNFAHRGAGVKIGILDTGIDCSHSDLSGRVIGGFDFVTVLPSFCYSHFHGTGVAGIIAATMNSSGVVGMAPEASLYSLRVCDSTCPPARIFTAIDWALSNGLKVLNLSFASCGRPADTATTVLRSKITEAYNAGITIVAAAGNGTSAGCPAGGRVSAIARLPETIAVSALQRQPSGAIVSAGGYQYGPEVDFAAPANVLTTTVGGQYQTFDGTSGAVPHVTGAVALLINQGYTTPAAIKSRLQVGASHVPAGGRDTLVGYGWANVWGAIVNGIPAPFISAIVADQVPITDPGLHVVTATVQGGISRVRTLWFVEYSNNPSLNYFTGWRESRSHTFNAPSGSYNIRITVRVVDGLGRNAGPSIANVPVCTEGGQALAQSGSRGGSTPDAKEGCGGDGGGDPPL